MKTCICSRDYRCPDAVRLWALYGAEHYRGDHAMSDAYREAYRQHMLAAGLKG